MVATLAVTGNIDSRKLKRRPFVGVIEVAVVLVVSTASEMILGSLVAVWVVLVVAAEHVVAGRREANEARRCGTIKCGDATAEDINDFLAAALFSRGMAAVPVAEASAITVVEVPKAIVDSV